MASGNRRNGVAVVTGACGFLGRRLVRHLADIFDVIACHRRHRVVEPSVRSLHLELSNSAAVYLAMRAARPTVIFHAAACARPDACEQAPGLAHRVNVLGTEVLARVASELRARLVYISTDMVFDGIRGGYSEMDDPNPVNVYGRTKLAGETRITRWSDDYVIVRLSLLYGDGDKHHRSPSDAVLDPLTRGEGLRLFADEYRSPLHVDDAVAGIVSAAAYFQNAKIHLGGPECVSRLEFGRSIATQRGYSPDLLVGVPLADHHGPAQRPRDCSLNSAKAISDLGFRARSLPRSAGGASR